MIKRKKKSKFFYFLILLIVFMLTSIALPVTAGTEETVPSTDLITWDLNTGITAENLISYIQGPGVTVSNIVYTGANRASGKFSGGDGIIGFENGIILSTGDIALVKGPNDDIHAGVANNTPGDSDLSALAGFTTYDAAVLEFDFIPVGDKISLQYVFASEEYNEFVGSMFSDVFAFFVNSVNYAVVGESENEVPVSVNTINNGYSRNSTKIPPSNPDLYINNDPVYSDFYGNKIAPEDLLNTQMDGLTVVLTLEAPVKKGETNTMKLAVADTYDRFYDSNIFIKAGSLTSIQTELPPENPTCRTYAQGYWKNHVEEWPEELSGSPFFSSGQTWLEVLNTATNGNAYYILAQQYIPAYLNTANGCTLPDAVKEAFDSSADFFTNTMPGALTVGSRGGLEQKIQRGEVLEWAKILDSWNNQK